MFFSRIECKMKNLLTLLFFYRSPYARWVGSRVLSVNKNMQYFRNNCFHFLLLFRFFRDYVICVWQLMENAIANTSRGYWGTWAHIMWFLISWEYHMKRFVQYCHIRSWVGLKLKKKIEINHLQAGIQTYNLHFLSLTVDQLDIWWGKYTD